MNSILNFVLTETGRSDIVFSAAALAFTVHEDASAHAPGGA